MAISPATCAEPPSARSVGGISNRAARILEHQSGVSENSARMSPLRRPRASNTSRR